MIKSIFPILAFEETTQDFVDNGTGFFINDKGYFISAGHIFQNKNRDYYASINDKLIIIEKVYEEYIEQMDQIAPTYKDLFIGKIEIEATQIVPLGISENILIGAELLACGYSTRNLNGSTMEVLSIDDLDYELDGNTSGKRPKYYEFPFKCNRLKIFRVIKNELIWFENGFSIDMMDKPTPGLSGGPLISDNLVRGLLIASDNCISSKYIIACLQKLRIEYK